MAGPRIAKALPALALAAATPAFASGNEPAVAGLAAFVAVGVGCIGGALAGWRGWRRGRSFLSGLAAAVAITAGVFALARPQDLGDGVWGLLLIAALAAALPLVACHFFAHAVARAISGRCQIERANSSR